MRNKVSLFHVVDFTPSVLALLGGILIALQLVLPAVAFASPTRAAAPKLATLQVYANNVYTSSPQSLLLSSSGFVPVTVRCSDTKTCSGGAALFAFHTDQPQPFLDVAPSTPTQSTPFGIELTKDGSLSAIPRQSNVIPQDAPQYLQQMPQFLTPTKESSSSTLPNATPVELGMPLVDSSGSLAGIQLNASGVFFAGQITQFLAAQPELRPSSVH